jgi:hypothetical protein
VDMRMRKPCVFSRLRTLGCQVRLVAISYLLLFQVILSQVDGSIRSDGRRPTQRQDSPFDAFVQTRFLLKPGGAIDARAFLRPIRLSNQSQK